MKPPALTDIQAMARYIHEWANATFPARTDYGALQKLVMEEIPELIIHKKMVGTADIGTELADCFILLLDLAVMWNVNLPEAIREKMEINERRMWKKNPDANTWDHVNVAKYTHKIVSSDPVDSEGGSCD